MQLRITQLQLQQVVSRVCTGACWQHYIASSVQRQLQVGQQELLASWAHLQDEQPSCLGFGHQQSEQDVSCDIQPLLLHFMSHQGLQLCERALVSENMAPHV